MRSHERMNAMFLSLLLLRSTSAASVPMSIRRHNEYSPQSSNQSSYACNAFNDYGELTSSGLNGTKCDCGDASIVQASEAPRNVTNFADSAQCTDYALISARGTLEPQGLSIGFIGMTFGTLGQVPNGAVHAVQYPAGIDQNTTLGAHDVVSSIAQGLVACPNRTYALYGYSQGATVILRALPAFTQGMFDSVKAVVLIGSPYRVPGKQSNVDGRGRRKKDNAIGVFVSDSDNTELPRKWDQSGKVIDICLDGDGICDSKQPCSGVTTAHLVYGLSQSVQMVGIKHVVPRLLGQT